MPRPRPAWSTAEVLVATGALSLVGAVAVFAAVAWDDLAGTAKAGLLLGLTALTVLVAGAARRRGLGATAEAVGLVAVALGVADVQVVRVALDAAVAPATVWAVGLALVAGAAVAGGRALGLRAVPAAGVALAFMPGIVVSGPVSAVAVAGALVATVAVAVAVDRWDGLLPAERAVLRTGGVLAWAAGCAVAAVEAAVRLEDVAGVGGGQESVLGPVLVLLGSAVVAVGGSLVGRWSRSSQGLVLGAAVAPVLTAVLVMAVAGPASATGVVAWVLGAAVLVVVAAALLGEADPSHPWDAMAGVAACVAASLVVVPALTVAVVVGDLLDVGVRAIGDGWTVGLDSAVAVGADRSPWVGVATVVQLLALIVLGAVWARRAERPDGGVAVIAAAVVGLAVVVPVLAGTPIGLAVGGLLLVAAAVVGVRLRGWELPGVVAVGLGSGAVALLLALPSEGLVLVATVSLTALAAVVAVLEADRGSSATPLWAGGACAALAAGAVLDVVRLGGEGTVVLVAALVGACVVAAVGPAVERLVSALPSSAPARRVVGDTVIVTDAVAALSFGAALALAQTADQASVVLGTVGVVAGVSSLRPSRAFAWRGAVAAAVAVTWLQLGQAEVEVVEAYTLPLALAVLVVAGWGRQPEGSWDRFGVGLAIAVGPTALLAVTTDDLARTVVTVVVGTALAVWGGAARLQAPLAVGSTVVAAVAVRHLAPVAVDLPRYLVLAAAGIVLLAVGATFEQRRADLRHARESFTRLG